MKLKELAEITGGKIIGNEDVEISGVAGINDAGPGDITYLANPKKLKDIAGLKASAFIVNEKMEGLPATMLLVDNPQYAFAKSLEVFYRKPVEPAGISEQAVIGNNSDIGADVSIYPFASIGNNVTLGAGVSIFSGGYVGDRVSIGANSVLHPNVTILENIFIGSNVVIHSGTVIGSDGFGYVLEKGKHYKIPQVGGVVIEDDVEIGANTVIDRATVGNTVIGSGTKIDNLVQIAHNVKIGKNCIIISQVGISGSVEIGNGVVLAGQVGVRDHITIGDSAIVGAQSGIGNNIPGGQVYSGSPAIPHIKWLRSQSIYSRLPELMKRLQELEKKAKREGLSDDE
jgi:UDP-3-O-[3-hydroxymyristoyl] glucosamine N-acyltransferase